MRTREKSYSHYGISPERLRFLQRYCKDGTSGGKDVLLHSICNAANEDIAKALFISITKGLSWERMDTKEPVLIGEKDFYAYRRKVYSLLNEHLRAGYSDNGTT